MQNICMDDLDSIILIVNFDYEKTPTNLNKISLFHITSKCIITCGKKVIEANSFNEIWHTRKDV